MRRVGVVAVAGGISGLVACASILGIEEAGFAEVEGGVAADGSVAETNDANDDRDRRRTDGGETAGPCRLPSGEDCRGACLETICSSCPTGTMNLATIVGTTTYAYSNDGSGPERLIDGRTTTNWVGSVVVKASDEERYVSVTLAASSTVEAVSIHSELPARAPKEVFIELVGVKLRSGPLHPEGAEIYLPTGIASGVREVRVYIRTWQGQSINLAPGISEIEVCGH